MITLSDKLEAAQAEVARNLREIAILKLDVKNYAEQADAALARLAEIESTHIDEVMNGLMLEKALANLQAQEPVGTVDRTAPGFVAWVGIPKLKDGAKLFAAAGASPMKPSQARELSDDEIDALLPTITLKGLDPKQQVWLTKKDAITFARAIIAAINAKGNT